GPGRRACLASGGVEPVPLQVSAGRPGRPSASTRTRVGPWPPTHIAWTPRRSRSLAASRMASAVANHQRSGSASPLVLMWAWLRRAELSNRPSRANRPTLTDDVPRSIPSSSAGITAKAYPLLLPGRAQACHPEQETTRDLSVEVSSRGGTTRDLSVEVSSRGGTTRDLSAQPRSLASLRMTSGGRDPSLRSG